MQPSPYDRTMVVLRTRFRRRPVAATAVVLACVWIAINVYQTGSLWHRTGFGWFNALVNIVSSSAFGVLALAGLVWLVERVFGEEPRS
jgi:hypothetical protein